MSLNFVCASVVCVLLLHGLVVDDYTALVVDNLLAILLLVGLYV